MASLTEIDAEASSYLQYLPAIFQGPDPFDGAVPFLGRFLLAFEKVLAELERTIDRLPSYFEPGAAPAEAGRQAPDEFLPWLAGCVALSVRQDWDNAQRRQFISRIVPLYRLRGTKAGLEELLSMYLPGPDITIKVKDDFPSLQIGVTSRVGQDTYLPRPHYFEVEIKFERPGDKPLSYRTQVARALIEQQKPAHTSYRLKIVIPTMKIGDPSRMRLGVNTYLGAAIDPVKQE